MPIKKQQIEQRLNNIESWLDEIEQLAEQIKTNYEFSAELDNLEMVSKLASNARLEVKDVKGKNQQ